MPYPVIAVGLALSAAGAAAGMGAQAMSRSAVDRERAAELNRQEGYRRQAEEVANQSVAQTTRPTADAAIDAGAAARFNAYAEAQKKALPMAAPVTENRVVNDPVASAQAQAAGNVATWNRLLGGAQARGAGYEDWGLAQDIKNSRAAQELGIIGTNARGSQQANQLELQDATHAGDLTGSIGNLLSAAGSVTSMYGATMPSPNYSNAFGQYFVDANGNTRVVRTASQARRFNEIAASMQ